MQNSQIFTRGSGLLEGFLSRQRTKRANSLINKDYRKGRILDIGCGFYPYFLTSTDFNEKYGIDPALFDSKISDINLQKLDITRQKLPFSNSFFDTVTMLAVFEHIETEKLDFVLSEIKRVLKDRGELIITTPAPWADKLLHAMALTGLISKVEIHDHKHSLKKDSIEKIFTKKGFKNVRSGFFELGFNMWFKIVK
ncbi:MAG: class I SAM-dependent methyltransferase [Candidatus Levybacteria bacterium]|nr:class I SAM-dependent methyltransferase [Candidatus Levybacteria bacterium]